MITLTLIYSLSLIINYLSCQQYYKHNPSLSPSILELLAITLPIINTIITTTMLIIYTTRKISHAANSPTTTTLIKKFLRLK